MLGRYHLIEAIEEDELGELHLARLEGPSGFQRWAVVRRMHGALESDPAMVDAFYEAARVAALVQHPNVAITFDVGMRQGPCWVAREYLHGESARDLLARTEESRAHVPWDIACRIVADIAQGVETLHEVCPPPPPAIGFLEGAITPGRAIVMYDGKSKVVEGCVPLVRGRPTLDPEAHAYRAPELSDAATADIRAEVFGLGVLLWELCAGKRLFGGLASSTQARSSPDSAGADVRARVATRAVPLLRTTIRCPRLIDDIVQRAVARNPDVRHASCRLFARELEGCLVSKGLVVSDDEVGKYMLGVFADRFQEREARLLSASNVTEVFDRAEIAARIADLQAAQGSRPEPPGDDIDNTETPEMMHAFGGLPPDLEGPETTRNVEAAPATRRSGFDDSTAETRTFRREEVETPEVTAAVFVLTQSQPESVAMPLVEVKAAPRLEKSRPAVRGFDELPTTRIDSPAEAPVPVPPESVVFVGNDRPVRTLRMMPSEPDDSSASLQSRPAYVDPPPPPRVTLPSQGYGELTPEPPPPRRATLAMPVVTPEPPPPRRTTLAMPVVPPRPPSLSAVLIAHEKKDRDQRLPLILVAAMGASAIFALVGYLRWRAARESADDGAERPTVFKESPSATATAPSPTAVAPVGRTPTPWVPVATDVVDAAPPPKVAPSATVRPTEVAPVRRGPPSKPQGTVTPAPPSGKLGLLTVLCTPACDDVLDGGRSLGPSPVFKVSVAAGSHRLTLRTDDPPVKKVVNVVVTEDDTTVVRESMDGEIGPGRY